MGIWRFAGAFAVAQRQSECGSKTAGMHVSQPMPIGVCYGLGAWLSFAFQIPISSNTAFHLIEVTIYFAISGIRPLQFPDLLKPIIG